MTNDNHCGFRLFVKVVMIKVLLTLSVHLSQINDPGD